MRYDVFSTRITVWMVLLTTSDAHKILEDVVVPVIECALLACIYYQTVQIRHLILELVLTEQTYI